MAKISGLKFDVIECEAGWQVECNIGDFTCYSPVKRTAEEARQLARKFAQSIQRHALFSEEPATAKGTP